MSDGNNVIEVQEQFKENLRFVQNDAENNISKFFGGSDSKTISDALVAPPRDFKIVTPKPGFCVKSFKVNTNEKYFINVCRTNEIPPPIDITEKELTKILESDEPSSYRIPMSISEPRITKDKSNNPVDVCDIAVNPQFFAKCEKSMLFKDFFLALIAEAISEKYSVQIKLEKAIILSNRKFIGTLVTHRVRNIDVENVLKSNKNPLGDDESLVKEIDMNELKKLKIQYGQSTTNTPEYKLRVKVREEQVEEVQAEFYLPKCISSEELQLNLGEDRIVLESLKHGYRFDTFVNYRLKRERASAIFNKTDKMLQVRIPVYPIK